MAEEALRKRKQQLAMEAIIMALFVLLITLIYVFIYFIKEENNTEKLINTIQDKMCGENIIGLLTDFEWEKGYSFMPYTSKEEMEKKLGFTSKKLQDNMTNDTISYIVFTKGEDVVCSFFSNRTKGVAFDLSEEFTPQSNVYILQEREGRKLLMASGEKKEEKEEKADKEDKAEPVKAQQERPVENVLKEEDIYTFLQGPKSWGERRVWSGEWGIEFYDGGSFGGFGCGLCCIANLYSTLTKYQCTPVQAYSYAKNKTDYSGGSAIDWGYLRQTLTSLGFDCRVKKKPSTYKEFQQDIAASNGTIVLVTSDASTSIWKDTPGHYVTLFLYDKEKDMVFLADSGEPARNRTWVPLKKVYRSLKTISPWQYLPVGDYDKDKDEWKHKNADGNWVQ